MLNFRPHRRFLLGEIAAKYLPIKNKIKNGNSFSIKMGASNAMRLPQRLPQKETACFKMVNPQQNEFWNERKRTKSQATTSVRQIADRCYILLYIYISLYVGRYIKLMLKYYTSKQPYYEYEC